MPPENSNAEKKKERLRISIEKYIASLRKVSGALLVLYGGNIPYGSETMIAFNLIKASIKLLRSSIDKRH